MFYVAERHTRARFMFHLIGREISSVYFLTSFHVLAVSGFSPDYQR